MDDAQRDDGAGQLLSKAEAATYLGGPPITVTTIEGLVRRREVAFVKVGRVIVFTRGALDDYIAAHTIAATPNAWGLSDASLARIRGDRAPRTRRKDGAA